MRRKITEVEQLADELPDLTEQQMRFVEGLLSGKSATDAYRAAYNTSGSQAPTIWANASRLRNDSKVQAWLGAAKKAEIGYCQITLTQYIQRLDALKQRCEDNGNFGAAVQSEQLIGKALGFFKETVEMVVSDFTDELRAMVAKDPALEAVAKAYAADKGITWQ